MLTLQRWAASPMTKSAKDLSVEPDLFDQLSLPPSYASTAKKPSATRKSKPTPSVDQPATKLLTVKEVAARYQVGVSAIWRWVKKEKDFTMPVSIGVGTSRWFDTELFEYERVAAAKRKREQAAGSHSIPKAGDKGAQT